MQGTSVIDLFPIQQYVNDIFDIILIQSGFFFLIDS